MKAGVVHAKNDIRYEEIEKPKATAGKVLIKVKYTGICGSDVPRTARRATTRCASITVSSVRGSSAASRSMSPCRRRTR